MKCFYIIQVTIIVTSLISCSQSQGGDLGEIPKDLDPYCANRPVRCGNGQCCYSTQYCGGNSDECENCTELESTDNIISRSRGQDNTLDFKKLIDAVDTLPGCRDYFFKDISRKVNIWEYNPDSTSTTTTTTTTTDTSSTTMHSQTDGCEPKGQDSTTMTVLVSTSLCFNVIAIFCFCILLRRNRQHWAHIPTKDDAEGAEGNDGGQPTGTTFTLHNLRSTPVVSDDQGEQTTAMTPSENARNIDGSQYQIQLTGMTVKPNNPRSTDVISDDQGEQTTAMTPSENARNIDGLQLQYQIQPLLRAAPTLQSAVMEDRSCGGDVQLASPRPGAQQSIHAQRSNGLTLNPIVSDQGGGNSVLAM